jgi:hypothetical protein
MTDTLFLRTPEAAKRLGLPPETLERLRHRGDGPPYHRLSRRCIVYAVASLDAFVNEREHKSTREYAAASSPAAV